MKAVMFCDSNYDTYKVKIKSVCGLVATLGVTLLTCSSKTHWTMTLSIIEAEYAEFSAYAQEVKFVIMLMREMS